MPYDQDHYRSLIARAAFNAEFWRGTIQDLSSAQRAMSFVGAPTWGKINGLPCLKQNAANDGATSGAVVSVVNTTTAFWCEVLLRAPSMSVNFYSIRQHDGGGNGFRFYWDINQYLVLMTLTNAFGAARYINTAVGTAPRGRLLHAIGWLDPVGLTGKWWVNGVPLTATFGNTGIPGLCGPTPIVINFGGPTVGTTIARVWQGTPTNEDAAALYGAAHVLTGGEV